MPPPLILLEHWKVSTEISAGLFLVVPRLIDAPQEALGPFVVR